MKEAVGNTYLYGFVIAMVGIIFLILIGSLSYSRVFKIKTKLIDIVERHKGYNEEEVKNEIDQFLKETGYSVVETDNTGTCPEVNGVKAMNTKNKYYDYCIYRFNTVKGPYYKVVVFISFDIPLASRLRIPVSGETRVIYDL